jgi:DNA mismatch endonuclease Vsr
VGVWRTLLTPARLLGRLAGNALLISVRNSHLKKKVKKPAKKSPSRKQIHYTMSRVRSSGSEIENILGRALWQAGVRYRKQYPIFGKPDFVIVKRRIAIFCDSEFWHGYRGGNPATIGT